MSQQPALFLLLLCCVALLFTSCGEPEPRTRLLFASGNGLVSNNQSVTGGTILSTSVYAETGTGNAIKNFKITCTYDDKDSLIYLDSTLNAPEFGLFFTFATRNVQGTETWAFTVTDEKSNIYRRQFILTTNSNNARQPFYTYSSYFYQKSAVENLKYFSLKDGTSYPGYAGRNNPAVKSKVDFYFNQNPDKSVSLHAVPGGGTVFRTTPLTPAEFSDIRTVEALTNVFTTSSGAPAEVQPSLRKNQAVAFRSNNKLGVIRIVAFDKAFDAERKDSILVRMRYEVKTQK